MWRQQESWSNQEILKLIALFRDEQNRLSEVLDELPLGVVLLSRAGKVRSANRWAVEKAGSAALEELGASSSFRNAIQRADSGDPAPLQIPGAPREVSAMLSAAGADRDSLILVLTGGMIAESADAAAPQDPIANASPLATFASGPDGTISFVNAALERLTGFPRRELLTMTAEDLLQPIEGASGGDLRFLRTTGRSPVWVRVHSSSGAGNPALHVHVLEHVEHASPLAPAIREMEPLERMAGEIAHRFNNLLTVIMSYSELIATRFGTVESIRDDVGRIGQAGGSAADLTAKLLTFSRGRPVDAVPVEIDPAIHEMRGLMEGILGPRIRLRLRLASPGAAIASNRAEIESLLLPLIQNSREAIGSHAGEVSITTSPLNPGDAESDRVLTALHLDAIPHISILVTDNGPGIPSEVLPRVFQPFVTTKEGHEGMGLPVVYGAAHRLGGNLGVQTDTPSGAAIRICLPVKP